MVTQLSMFHRIIQSINYSEEDIIIDILSLHSPAGEIDIDPTYSKGMFYSGKVPQPKLKFDITPQLDNVIECDCRNLPISDNSIGCLMFDPPFLISMEKNPDNIMANRFSYFSTWDDLVEMYTGSLEEFHRIIYNGGIVIFKCQDVLNGSYQFFSHVAVMQLAVQIGFYPKDLFILMKKNRITHKNKKQHHARKHHSYFWVFEKNNKRVFSISI